MIAVLFANMPVFAAPSAITVTAYSLLSLGFVTVAGIAKVPLKPVGSVQPSTMASPVEVSQTRPVAVSVNSAVLTMVVLAAVYFLASLFSIVMFATLIVLLLAMSWNAWEPMLMLSLTAVKSTVARLPHDLNAELPISVTVPGIVTSVIPEKAKQLPPMDFNPAGRVRLPVPRRAKT